MVSAFLVAAERFFNSKFLVIFSISCGIDVDLVQYHSAALDEEVLQIAQYCQEQSHRYRYKWREVLHKRFVFGGTTRTVPTER